MITRIASALTNSLNLLICNLPRYWYVTRKEIRGAAKFGGRPATQKTVPEAEEPETKQKAIQGALLPTTLPLIHRWWRRPKKTLPCVASCCSCCPQDTSLRGTPWACRNTSALDAPFWPLHFISIHQYVVGVSHARTGIRCRYVCWSHRMHTNGGQPPKMWCVHVMCAPYIDYQIMMKTIHLRICRE